MVDLAGFGVQLVCAQFECCLPLVETISIRRGEEVLFCGQDPYQNL